MAHLHAHNSLEKSFYTQDTLLVAENLIGKIFVRKIGSTLVKGVIVETEAYHQDGDLSCHAANGKTKRNAVMFEEGGCLYVYFTYGMHYCMNIVTEQEGIASAVLIRAIQPIEGVEFMKQKRKTAKNEFQLTNGPAKTCQAFSITTKENGTKLIPQHSIWVENYWKVEKSKIERSVRVGISSSKDLLWRFYLKDNAFVSKKNCKVL